MEYIIETQDLTKRYGQKHAVNRVSIRIQKGEIYGLIGKNGAGKTTLMKLLLGMTQPSEGGMKLFGSEDLTAQRQRIGSLVEEPALYPNATAYENMKRAAILCNATEEQIQKTLKLVDLADTGKKKAGAFSLGMRQRLGIAMALLDEPELLVLDEPVNGLDPAGIKDIRDLLLKLHGQGVTILISSHLLDELGRVATRFGIMVNGILTSEISAEALQNMCRSYLTILTDTAQQAAQLISEKWPEYELTCESGEVRILSDVEDTSAVNAALVNAGIRVYEIKHQRIGVESYFIERMG